MNINKLPSVLLIIVNFFTMARNSTVGFGSYKLSTLSSDRWIRLTKITWRICHKADTITVTLPISCVSRCRRFGKSIAASVITARHSSISVI